MFQITLSTREFDDETRLILRQNGAMIELADARDQLDFGLFTATFASLRCYIDALSSIADERDDLPVTHSPLSTGS